MMEVRRYIASDHDAVWDLHNLALNEVGAHAGSGPWDDDLHRIDAEYIDAGGEFYVGIIDGRIVAMGALKRLTDTRSRDMPDAGSPRPSAKRVSARESSPSWRSEQGSWASER